MVAKSKTQNGRLGDQVTVRGQRVGYVRVSSVEQSTARQLEGVQLDRLFEDKASGKDRDRPQLSALLQFVRDGDTVLVHSMDRLSRNLDDCGAR
jgi:DNA invertase Pin-like site-specific DNA recombinase